MSNKKYTQIAFLVFVSSFGVASLCLSLVMLNKLDSYAAENERLRLFNARRERRISKPRATPRIDAINRASHIMGTDKAIITAVWRQENGPPDIETGSIGKTDFWAKHTPVNEWAAFEAARTMNRMAWEWLTETEEGRTALKKMLGAKAQTYTAGWWTKSWAKNTYQFTIEEKKKNMTR